MKKYTLKELQAMKTLCIGQTDELKVETSDTRVWLSRMTNEVAEVPYNNQVTVEKLIDNEWVVDDEYEAR